MKLTALALLLILVASCAGPVTISPRRCMGNGLWTTAKGGPLSSYSKKVWTGVKGKTLYLRDILAENKMSCAGMGGVSIQITQTASDFLLSLIPFVSRKTVNFNFYSRPIITEEAGDSKDN